VGSTLPDGPIEITRDLPPFRCVDEGSELSLSVDISGGTPNEPLEYQWSRDGVVVDGQVSSNLRIAHATSTTTGGYRVEVWCQSQPTKVASSVAKVRIVSSVMERVNSILANQGASLTDDRPRAILFDFAGQRMYYTLQRLLLTGPLTVYIVLVALTNETDLDFAANEDNPNRNGPKRVPSWSLDDPLTCDEDLRYGMTHRQNLIFWLNTIFGLAPNAKIIVVCTKVEVLSKAQREERMEEVKQCVEKTLSGAKDMIVDFVPVSSKTGEGINMLRSQIELLRSQLDGYGKEVLSAGSSSSRLRGSSWTKISGASAMRRRRA
jgi:hypothetical protein